MLSRLAERITLHLQEQEVTSPEEYEIYRFGMENMLGNVVNLVSTILLGVLFHELLACVIFCISFKAIRSNAGGYHAKTQVRCCLLSMGVLILTLSAIKHMTMDAYTLCVITTWAVASICVLAPVEAENNPLDIVERGMYRRKTWLVCALEILVLSISSWHHWDVAVKSIVCVLVVTAISMIVGYVDLEKRKRNRGTHV